MIIYVNCGFDQFCGFWKAIFTFLQRFFLKEFEDTKRVISIRISFEEEKITQWTNNDVQN
jgi:hypothetical protein